jgi:putative ABC transport system permease protein
VRDAALNQESPEMYYPMASRVAVLMDVVVRTDQVPASLLPAIHQKAAELDPELPMANIRTMDEWVSNSAAQPRLNAVLLTVFSAIAVLIASIGIYGVLAYSVSQRTNEIGLRMALGASAGDILRLIAGQGMWTVMAGIGVGVLAALALGGAMASLTYDVTVRDPATYAIAVTLLFVVALAACIVPAYALRAFFPRLPCVMNNGEVRSSPYSTKHPGWIRKSSTLSH